VPVRRDPWPEDLASRARLPTLATRAPRRVDAKVTQRK
jgi:hypothetical protein